MKRTLLLSLAIILISCKKNSSTQHNNSEGKDTITKNDVSTKNKNSNIDSLKIVHIGHYDKYEKLPKLAFDTITELEFNSLRSKKYIQDFQPEEKNNFFYIPTAIKKNEFKKYISYSNKECWGEYEFLGYYPDSKLFAMTENSTNKEGLQFGELFLLDSLTNYRYNIISFTDGSVQLPIPSITNKYFVYYDNMTYQHKDCDIAVLKINDRSIPEKFLTEYASYHSTEFAIEKIVWKSDNSLYIKGYQEVYENENWVKKYTYYKTEFK